VANDQQIRIGGIFSSPLVANGVVYFGSADGFLYALE
jgi:outer membrane protein assembly factor BamB